MGRHPDFGCRPIGVLRGFRLSCARLLPWRSRRRHRCARSSRESPQLGVVGRRGSRAPCCGGRVCAGTGPHSAELVTNRAGAGPSVDSISHPRGYRTAASRAGKATPYRGWTRSDTTRCGWCHPGRSPPSPVLPLASAPWVKRRYAVGRAGRNLEATPAMGSRTRPRGARSGGVPPSGPADQVAEIRRLAAVAPRDRRSTIPSRVPRGPPARRRSSGSSYRNA